MADTLDIRRFERSDAQAIVNQITGRDPEEMIRLARNQKFGQGMMNSFLEPQKKENDHKIGRWKEWMHAVNESDTAVLRQLDKEHKARAIDMFNSGKLPEFNSLAPWLEGTTTAGGYSVPPEYAADIARNIGMYGIARRYFRQYNGDDPRYAGAKSYLVNIPYISAKPTTGVAVVAENSTIAASKPTEGNLQITVKKLAAIWAGTNEFLQDTNIDSYSIMLDIYGEQFQIQEDTGALQNANTNWNGLLWYGAGAITSGIAANGAIAVSRANSSTGGKTGYPQIGDAAADATDSWADLLFILQQQPSALYAGGMFFMDQNILIALLSMRDTQHRFIADIANGLSFETGLEGQPVIKFRGYPIVCVPSGIMLTYDASAHVSTPFTAFCNPQRSWVCMTQRGGFRVDNLREGTIDGTSLAGIDAQALRMIERVGFGTALPFTVTVLRTDAS